MSKIKILYVEDEKLVGDAIVNNLRNYDSFEVGDLLTGDIITEYDELAIFLEQQNPNVLLLDMDLYHVPDGGLKILRAIKKRSALEQMKVIIVSTRYKESEKDIIKASLNAKVSGFIGKDADWDKLVSAIHMVHQGRKNIFSQSIIDILASNWEEKSAEDRAPYPFNKNVPFEYSTLTKKEKEVFALICQGIERNERLRILNVAVKTYDYHWSNIKDKLDAKNEVQCLLYALDNRIDVGLKNWD